MRRSLSSSRRSSSVSSISCGLVALLALVLLSGCETLAPFVNVQGTFQTSTTINGKTETTKVSFDKLEDMPAAFSQATDHLSKTTDALITELSQIADAPPPGVVQLSDLSPRLKRYEKSQVDFLYQAAQSKEDPRTFTYVQIGVPTYDQFFKVSTELYAITFQAKQGIVRGKQLAFALLDRNYDTSTALVLVMQEAFKSDTPPDRQSMRGQLMESREVLLVLGDLGPAFLGKAQELVSTGQQLITAAPTSILNPRTLLHLGLITQGLEESITATLESGSILTEMVEELVALVAG